MHMEYLATDRILVEAPNGERSFMDCPLNLLCGLVIARGVETLSDLEFLTKGPVSFDEIQRALTIVTFAESDSPRPGDSAIDVGRIMRDAKYALHIQEMIGTGRVMASVFRGNVLVLTMNALGCRVIQKILDVCDITDALGLVHPELSMKVVECALDVNGNHVIQKCIDKLPSEECRFIIESIDEIAVKRLSAHCYGCRVIQRLMSRCGSPMVDPIFESLCSDPFLIASLSEDVFGNYVMQHVLDYGRPIDRERICICLASLNIVEFGCSKFASNVIEKAIRTHKGDPFVTRLVLHSILSSMDGEHGILTLMKDRYGNYVVRAIIELNSRDFTQEVDLVKSIILANAHQLKKYTFSWHLVERLDKMP
jgi:pumilio RNA-binding family